MPLPVFSSGALPRPHVSFSEALTHTLCPYNRWMSYEGNIKREDTLYTVYGKEIGAALERYKKNNVKNAWISLVKNIFRHIAENDFDEIVPDRDRDWRFWARCALRHFKETLEFLDEKYPGWELIGFEYPLYEPLSMSGKKFKGFIDIIFKYKGRIKILDFKTTTLSWDKDKRSDTKKLYQVVLYKHFYCLKNDIDPDLVDVGYLLLIRRPPVKRDTSIELFEQTSGKVKTKNAVEWIEETAKEIEQGIMIKNKYTCSFCQCGQSEETKKWEKIRSNKK